MVVKIITTAPKIPLNAKITSVNMKGLMTVTFSDAVITPGNYSKFNDQFLRLRVIPGEEPRPEENKSI